MNGFIEQPLAAVLDDGRRLNLRHGPIELVIEALGPEYAVAAAYRRANAAFRTVLADLVGELELLRRPVTATSPVPAGAVAGKMHKAARAHAPGFITPMAAVAGAVADHMVGEMTNGSGLERAYVNNGGDIALYLTPGNRFDVGICANPATGRPADATSISEADDIRGVATSGWRGRSHSLGIADAVTVLAADAATADAAATMIANGVRLDRSPRVRRMPANELSPDSDLGDMPVTVAVERLADSEIDEALDGGARLARDMMRKNLIAGAFLCLAGEVRVVGGRRTGDRRVFGAQHDPQYEAMEKRHA